MVAVLVVGIGVVFLVLWLVVFRGGYAEVGRSPDSVEHVHLRRVAEGRVSALCAGAIRLAEMERAGGVRGEENRCAREFWRRFAAASSLVEEDPAASLRELRGLTELLAEALREVESGAGRVENVAAEEDGR